MPNKDCRATKKDGDPCQYRAREGHLTCWRHRTQEAKLQMDSSKVTAPKSEEEE